MFQPEHISKRYTISLNCTNRINPCVLTVLAMPLDFSPYLIHCT